MPTQFSPDLAPSPNPYAPGSPVDPRAAPGPFQGPPMPQFSPDLAPSPSPYSLGSPVNPRPTAGGPKPKPKKEDTGTKGKPVVQEPKGRSFKPRSFKGRKSPFSLTS